MHNQSQNHIHCGGQYSRKLECDSCLNVNFLFKRIKYINGEEEIVTKKGGHSQKGKQENQA